MATIVLGAVGGAIGANFGGAVMGLSGAVIGRAAGATLGRVIDQRLMGTGSQVVESGRLDRLRLTGAAEGTPLARIWGRVRVAGQVIWATRFVESSETRRVGGKGGTRVQEYSYSVSLAIALCEGPITGIGRIWADGVELPRDQLVLRIYEGTEDQLPDPRIAAVEGAENAPAYRGVAYVVIEDLDLAPHGNRVPQFTFEVLRSAQGDETPDLMQGVRAVALIPGTGEFALATEPVPGTWSGDAESLPALPETLMPGLTSALGEGRPSNVNSASGLSDMELSLAQLTTELPQCRSVLLVVSWFGDDLRCGSCTVRPMVENAEDAPWRAWRAGGIGRDAALEVPKEDGRAIYGGTPTDATIPAAIAAMHAAGQEVVFYPFLLMRQMAGNDLPNPWTGGVGQPVLPWRGRITASEAPGRPDSPDRTGQVDAEVAAFFGTAQPGDFAIVNDEVVYTGPSEDWGYRRFILHYAWLVKLAGGVAAFCVGSEMRALTQLRGAGDNFPAVQAFRQLAADVRSILGPEVKISYAADWSEYFGYNSPGGNRYFHLDPLWADANVDFIGIDNYMPLSDWRDGEDNADAAWGSVYDLSYLRANVAGGEGFDWYYASAEDAAAQLRTAITDGAHGEPWVWRYKDLRGWWENPHHERIDGVRQPQATAWVPRSKPFWFTELGCPAVDKGTNQPNVFLDPKSSESFLPRASNGLRDDAIQLQYHRAMMAYWADPANNPVSPLYGGPMVDMARAHVWAWDARPFPAFPALLDVWSDGDNWVRGHWITGRTALQPLAAVVAEICARSGLGHVDVSGLHGVVRGLAVPSTEPARAVLQSLMLAYGFEALERDGELVFQMRRAIPVVALGSDDLVARGDGDVERVRAARPEVPGRVRLSHIEAEADFEVRAVEASLTDALGLPVSQSDVPLVLTEAEARGIAERWLAEAQVARDSLRLSVAPSSRLRVGDVFAFATEGAPRLWRIDRIDTQETLDIEAVRVEPGPYVPSEQPGVGPRHRAPAVTQPLLPVFMDLPLMTGAEVPHAPHLAVVGGRGLATTAVFDALPGEGFRLNRQLDGRAAVGFTQTPLLRAAPGRWDRGAPLRIRMLGATLQSGSDQAVLAGANLMAIGDGGPEGWELMQFARAEMVGPATWDVWLRLRGRFGTDADMPDVWPSGALVVMMGEGVGQVELAAAARGLPRRWRVGSADLPHDDPSHVEVEHAFQGMGLRPYAPVHLRGQRLGDGALRLDWLRRGRIDSDSWEGREIPLGEAEEAYVVHVIKDGDLRRVAETDAPNWTYDNGWQQADGVSPPFTIAVAQLSQSFGPGPFTEVTIDE